MVGRAVWTDDRGDKVFSELSGTRSGAGSRVQATLIGGTGRYAGVTGNYEFSWRLMLETEDGTVQGQSMDLKGRFRVLTPQATGGPSQ
jgi:hypothetical protein